MSTKEEAFVLYLNKTIFPKSVNELDFNAGFDSRQAEIDAKDKEISELKEKLKEYKRTNKNHKNNLSRTTSVESLKQQLKESVDVIKFYKYGFQTDKPKYERQGKMVRNIRQALYVDGGEKAKQFLEKIKE